MKQQRSFLQSARTKTDMTEHKPTNRWNAGHYYLTAKDSAALEADLGYFGREQLLELAGLGVAEAVYQVVSSSSTIIDDNNNNTVSKIMMVCCGPGRQGGYGLVAARHLAQFGYYDCVVVHPNQRAQEFGNLVQQCQAVGVPVLDDMPDNADKYRVIVDAMGGGVVEGILEEPFPTIVHQINAVRHATPTPVTVISVDVPCGWDLDQGGFVRAGTRLEPDVLVSLTAPKECARGFEGRHFVAGRYLSAALAQKYSLQIPSYPGVSQVVELTIPVITTLVGEAILSHSIHNNDTPEMAGWEAEYAAYLKERETNVDHNVETSVKSQRKVETPPKDEMNGSWERDYQEYCAEKEARLQQQDEELIKMDMLKPPPKQEVIVSWAQQYQDHCLKKEAKLTDQNGEIRKKEQPHYQQK